MKRWFFPIGCLLSLSCCLLMAEGAPGPTTEAGSSQLKTMTWKVGGVTREALVYLPPTSDNSSSPPLVFAFHGHGGRSQYMARKLPIHKFWPGAICVYPQGLPTAVPVIDVDGKMPGWQKFIGDESDRDLAFFDAMLQTMKTDYHVDEKRIFVAGHSNGGFFTYLLWAARGDELAAIAPISALDNEAFIKLQKPKPVFHVAGERDQIVRFALQQQTMEAIRKRDRCDPTGQPDGEYCTKYTSRNGPTVITYIHPGGHMIPDGAPPRIAEFFKTISSTH
jgi:polyhydroxybutyrate depolymerase